MKKTFSFLAACLMTLMLLLSPMTALAENRIVGEWHCDDGDTFLVHTLIFRADGTGDSINPKSTIPIVDWQLVGSDVQFSYYYGDSLSTASGLYTYTYTSDGPAIVYDNGSRQRIFLPVEKEANDAAGLWSCVLSDNTEVTLQLDHGGSATLKVGAMTFNANWSLSGTTLVLMQNNNPLMGTLKGNNLVLTFAGVTLNMSRVGASDPAFAREDLIGEWHCNDGDDYLVHTLIFRADGTGDSINPSSSIDVVDWQLVGSDVQFSYYWGGSLSTAKELYTITNTADGPAIVYDNGSRQRTFLPVDNSGNELLIGEWYCDDFDSYLVHTLIFQAGGKGVSINPASAIDIVDWKLVGNDVQFSYYRDGELTTASGLYTYTTTADGPVIVYNNGIRQRTFKLMTEMDEDDYYGL